MIDRKDICYSKNISEILFDYQLIKEDFGKINIGVELTPFDLGLNPIMACKDFKMYHEHLRLKGEFSLSFLDKQNPNDLFGPNANIMHIVIDKRYSGRKEVVKMTISNVDFYEINNFVRNDGTYTAHIKWIMRGLLERNKKVLTAGGPAMAWMRRLGVEIYE